ncbi:hypothetical protein HYPSUDRAFT_48622 [Hypholoma sublateritium FD-334 SS-4]|uniref:Ubiquitin 3 binding protein But2 C-terminal domain-containing protein n=1 Tax=Hypholoma sublateritium (strain FD-334 SS-4) TaxID=945553 RepID=A0A0D2NET9_HYPSF|nr:hypothetical protein HYPSUDRAFT_48622 [Hypholoma sublateritium FD-334 SS-4]
MLSGITIVIISRSDAVAVVVHRALKGRQYALILGLIAFIGLCAFVDLLSLAYLGFKLRQTQSLGAIPVDDLPFLSSYSHLDDMYKTGNVKATPRDPVMQLPFSLTQVDSSAPDKFQKPYPHVFKSPAGLIPYNERRTTITPEISTIAQFFGEDYGMENCTVVLTIPPEARPPKNVQMNALFDVWALDWSRTIDFRRLSWNNKPPRRELLGWFSAEGAPTQQTEPFACPSGTYQHIEVSCRAGPCALDIVASGIKQFTGIYMTQHQTI